MTIDHHYTRGSPPHHSKSSSSWLSVTREDVSSAHAAHTWPVDQVVTEATRGRDAVLEDVRRRPCHTWCSARSRGHAQSSPRYESSPSRAPSARGHSKMSKTLEVLQRDHRTGKSFYNSVSTLHVPRRAPCNALPRLTRRRRRQTQTVQNL